MRESAFSETASWFAFLLDARQVIRSQNRHIHHESKGEIINLAFVPFSELLTINTFQVHCGFISFERSFGKNLWPVKLFGTVANC